MYSNAFKRGLTRLNVFQRIEYINTYVKSKKRGILEVPTDSKETMIIKKSKEIDNVLKHIENTKIIKSIYIKNKLLNFITEK